MIIVDEECPDVKKAAPHRVQESQASESSQLTEGFPAPPPAYSDSTSTSYGATYSAPLHYPEDVLPQHQRSVSVGGGNARKRFFKALVVAVGIFFLLSILVDSIGGLNIMVKRKSRGGKGYPDGGPGSPVGSPGKEPVGPDRRIRDPTCIINPQGNTGSDRSSPDNPHSVELKFSLPVASNLSFFGNDTFAYGKFAIDTVESSGSDVDVDVVISYQTPKALRHSKVCLFREGTENTLGIMAAEYDPDPSSSVNILRYDIYVKVPVSSSKKPVYVPRVTADLTSFTVGIAQLSGRVEFGEFDLRTLWNHVLVESLTAHRARVQTSQSSIKGKFVTSSSLELITENAPIYVDISMLNAESTDHPPTHVAMHTKNGVISARLNLSNPSPTSSLSPLSDISRSVGGNFNIDSTTSDAALSLSVLSQPHSSHLTLTAHTSKAAAQVFLPPQFSGGFRLASSDSNPIVDVSPLPEEDTNRRRDVVFTDDEPLVVKGNVTWVDGRGRKERGGGLVDIRTSVFPAILKL